MKEQKLTVTENRALTESVYRMELAGEALEAQKPGQFVNIRLDGLFLRRPISVYDSEEGRLVIIYKAVGRGTRQMTGLKPGTELDVLTDVVETLQVRDSGVFLSRRICVNEDARRGEWAVASLAPAAPRAARLVAASGARGHLRPFEFDSPHSHLRHKKTCTPFGSARLFLVEPKAK